MENIHTVIVDDAELKKKTYGIGKIGSSWKLNVVVLFSGNGSFVL